MYKILASHTNKKCNDILYLITMTKTGGSSLTQIAVPAALFYANHLFGSKRRRPVPATFRKKTSQPTLRRKTQKRRFKKRRTSKSRS